MNGGIAGPQWGRRRRRSGGSTNRDPVPTPSSLGVADFPFCAVVV